MAQGQLSFKQAGIGLSAVGALVIGMQHYSSREWVWNGIPVIYVGALFAAAGVLLLLVGLVKRA